ncbi:MAG: hypothetical protein QW158_01265 [Nitrososphaerales archaeon]
MVRLSALKREFLELLEKDVEFRYAVAGYLGFSEILKRLDFHSEQLVRLRDEQVKIWNEIKGIKDEQLKIWNEIKGIKDEQLKIRDEQVRLRDEQVKIWNEIKGIKDEQLRLREDFNRMLEVIGRMDLRLSRVERTLEKLTVDVEDEARSIIRWRVRVEFGVDVELAPLILPDLELDIYGVSDGLCVVGEATVRGGVGVLRGLLEKVERLKVKYPDRVRGRLITVVYASLALPELVEAARESGVWVLKATGDYYKPVI